MKKEFTTNGIEHERKNKTFNLVHNVCFNINKNITRLRLENKERKSFRGMESGKGVCFWWRDPNPVFIQRQGKHKGYMRNLKR